MNFSRRHFISTSASFAMGLTGLQLVSAKDSKQTLSAGYGPLKKDPKKILDLPNKFSYRVVSRAGEQMDDGFYLPSKPDGMATFPGRIKEEMILVRNHEINPDVSSSEGPFGRRNKKAVLLNNDQIYDSGKSSPCLGGTTSLVYNTKDQRVVRQFLSLAGTARNCAGGLTPWNSWITCEETVVGAGGPCKKDHGWCFEVPANDQPLVNKAIPLKAMGRFNHEAVAVDPDSGSVFLTEDRHEGLLYRFVPNVPGKLELGGKLYAMCISGSPSFDTRNWQKTNFKVGQSRKIQWIEMDEVESPKDDLRFRGFARGAACFARGEGMWYSKNAIYFACTNGGSKKRGQVWKISSGTLELYAEPNNPDLVDNCDNITVSPWGDMILCEDGGGKQYLDVITPEGDIFKLAKNSKSSSEFAGATFSPDGSTLFVNIQVDGLTLAITGPWDAKQA